MTYTPPLFSDQNLFRHPAGTLRGYWGATRVNGKDGGSLGSPSLVCGDRLTNVLVSGMMGARNGGIAVAPYLCRYYYSSGSVLTDVTFWLHLTYTGIITHA